MIRIQPCDLLMWILKFLSIAVIFQFFTSSPGQADSKCLISIDKPNNAFSSVAYRDRGDRCEGLYIQTYSQHSEIVIVGYLAGQIVLPKGRENSVRVFIGSLGEEGAQLIIQDLIPAKFYQMDQTIPPGVEQTEWSLRVIRDTRVNLGSPDLTAIACSPSCSFRNKRLLPVQISTEQNKGTEPFILFQFPLDTERVQVKLKDVHAETYLQDFTISRRYLNLGSAQLIRVPEMKRIKSGLLEIRAYLSDGTSTIARAMLSGISSQ